MNINRGWIGDIAVVMACYAILVYLCRVVLPKKYRYMQEGLASFVVWASAVTAIIWLMGKKNTIGIMMGSLGLSGIELPFFQSVIQQMKVMFMHMSVNMAFGLFLLGYLIFKTSWLLWKRHVIKKSAGPLSDVCGAYRYYRSMEAYVLNVEYVQHRKWYQVLFLASGLVLGLAKCAVKYTGSYMELLVMSVAISLYLWERLEYFSGCTLEEYTKGEGKEKKNGLEVSEIVSLLKEKGKPYLISVHQREKADVSKEALSLELEEKLMEIQLNENYKKRCMGYEWYQTIKGSTDIHMELVEAALMLADHQSLYFTHVCYRDIGPYIFPFLELELLDNRKILVICTGQEDEELSGFLEAGLSGKVGKLKLWMAGGEKEIGDADIGIVSFQYMEEAVKANDSERFFRQISTVLFFNPSCLIASYPVAVLKLLARLRPGKGELTYIVCDRNGVGMSDWLSHACKAEFSVINVVNTRRDQISAIIDIDATASPEREEMPAEWKAAKLLFQYTKYTIQWCCDRLVPVRDLFALQGRYAIGRWDSERKLFSDERKMEKAYVRIVEDNCYHVQETLRQAGMAEITAVCSPHYMLRGYITFCMEAGRAMTISQMLPELIHSERNLAIAVADRLLKGGVDWLELKELAEYYGADVQKGLIWLLGELNRTLAESLELDCVWLIEDMMSQRKKGERRAVISTEEGRQQLNRWHKKNMDSVVYKREGAKEVAWPEPMAGCHIFQQYLPGQFVTLGGGNYQIEDIFLKQGKWVISLKRSADSCNRRQYYRQLRKVILAEDIKYQSECVFQHGEVMVELCRGDLVVQTDGYLCSRKFFDIRKADYKRVPNVPDRIYKKKSFLKISAYNQNCMWIGILLKEVLYTLFPHSWQLLSVAVGERWWKEELRGHMDVLISSEARENRDIIYVIEDSMMDLGLVEAIGAQFEQIRAIINEYVEWGNMEGKEEVREYFGDELLDKLRLTGIS